MYKWFTLSLAAMATLFMTSAISLAGEETRVAAAEQINKQTFAAAKGVKMSKRAAALDVAAELGVLNAQLKLATMYVTGKDVPRSDVKAFDLYQRIVEDHADVRPHHASAGDVARAFVALGNYYRTGIPGSSVRIDKRRASSLMRYAASYLGDAEAQCILAQMYLDGEGVPYNGRLAVNWLTNAAKKRHGKSQAILGDLLWRGAKDVTRQPRKGLALLSLARQNARDEDEARWIDELYAGAYSGSKASERKRAAKLAARWQARMGRADFVVRAPVKASAEPVPADKVGAVQASGLTNVGMSGQSALR